MPNPSERARWIQRSVVQFKGYAKREDRRDSETAFREYLVQRLDWHAKRLGEASRDFLPLKDSEQFVKAMAAACAQIEDISDQVRAVPYAYGEFFNAPDFPETMADEFHGRDEKVLRNLDALQSLTDPTLNEYTNVGQLTEGLASILSELTAAIQQRQTFIGDFLPPRP